MLKEITLITASGISLLLLFPIGLYSTGLPFLVLFLIHLLIHLYALGNALTTIHEAFFDEKSKQTLLAFIGGVVLPLLFLAILSAAPVITRDALIHHLAVPKMWLQVGSIHEIPWHEWSYYPMLIQLAYTGFLSLGLEQLVSIYHGSFLLLLASLIVHFGSGRLSKNAVQLGVILSLTTPLFFRLGSSPYVDIPLIVFGFGAFLLVVNASEQTESDGRSTPLLLGALLGLTAGTKYNGLLFSGLLGGYYCFVCLKTKEQRKALLPFLTSLILIGSPWYVRNLLLTENPVFPLLASIFPGTESGLIQVPSTASSTPPSRFDKLLFPLHMILFGEDDSPFGYDGILSPLFLVLFIAPLSKANRKVALTGLFLFLAYAYTAVELSGLRTRYLAPVLGVSLVLTLISFDWLSARFSTQIGKLFWTLLLFFQIGLGGYYAINLSMKRDVLPVLSGEISPAKYRNLKVTESLLADVVATKLPDEAKIYLLHTGNRYYLYDRAVFNSGYFSDRHILTWIKNPSVPIGDAFKKEGITHVAFHKERYLKAFASYKKEKFLSEEELKKWNAFATKDFSLLFEIGPYLIGEVK